MRQDGVHRTDIDVVGIARFYGVLKECFQTSDDILEALDIGDVLYEPVHALLTLGEFHLSVLLPELLVAHLGVSFGHLFLGPLEELEWDGVESVVRQAGGAGDNDAGRDEVEQFQFCHHIVLGQHPLAVGRPCVFLGNLHLVDKVDGTLLGNGHLAAADMKC